jgi:replication factor A1
LRGIYFQLKEVFIMINIPLPQIKERISQKTGMPEDEINQKIKAKLKQLPGLISEEGAAHIVANELGVKLFDIGEKLQIKNILAGMRNVDIVGKVLQKYELREFVKENTSGKVANLLIGDETGVIRIVLWNKQAELLSQISEGDVLKIRSGYVRENNGRKEVHLNDMSKLIINPPGVTVEVKPYTPATPINATRKQIAEISEADANVEILATIVQVFDLNFFEVCPQCNKRVRLRDEGFACQTHGKVQPDYNFVLNLYLDDGSDNIRVVFWREQVEQLLSMNKTQIMAFKEDPSKFEPIKTELLGNMIKITGRANKNQNFDRFELVANQVERNPNPDDEIKKLKEEAAKVVEQKEEQKPLPKEPEPRRAEPKKEFTPKSTFKPTPAEAAADETEDSTGDGNNFESFNLDEELEDPDGTAE